MVAGRGGLVHPFSPSHKGIMAQQEIRVCDQCLSGVLDWHWLKDRSQAKQIPHNFLPPFLQAFLPFANSTLLNSRTNICHPKPIHGSFYLCVYALQKNKHSAKTTLFNPLGDLYLINLRLILTGKSRRGLKNNYLAKLFSISLSRVVIEDQKEVISCENKDSKWTSLNMLLAWIA